MDDIPQDVLFEAHEAGHYDSPYAFLRVVAGHFADRAERLRSLRKKGWQTANRELDGVADHIRAYAEQLERFAANNPDGVSLVGDPCGALHPHLKSECVHESGHEGDHGNLADGDWASSDGTPLGHPLKPGAKRKGKEAPQLPGNTGRCASFRRATPDDPMVCYLERGHEGEHAAGHDTWPRTPSGHVCGDVVILHDGTALNCARPLGHDGDEHYDGAYRLWPRGVGTRREVRTCERCNRDEHGCPGCGEPLNHFVEVCDGCKARETDDGPIPPAPVSDLVSVPPCGDPQPDTGTNLPTTCMLPTGHTGKHIGYTGARWDQAAKAEPATLADIAEQQRATMVIPEQRAESDPVPTEVPAPAAVLVAEMKEEVSTTVADFAMGRQTEHGPIEPPKLSEGHDPLSILPPTPGEFPVLGNPFAVRENATAAGFGPGPESATVSYVTGGTLGNPFRAPAPPPAAFLPPHLVPGTPKAHQSHSSITTMEKCGLQYRLKYRDGIGDDTPAWWNVAGTAFHAIVQAIESNYAGGLALWSPDTAHMQQEREAAALWKEQFSILVDQTERESGKARSTWKAAKGGKEGESFWREYGGDLARMYVAHRRRFLAEPEGWRLLSKPGGEGWAHEVEFNATIDGVLLKGFIDSAWISADGGTILIEDFKSGSSEGDPFQPKLYGAALRALGFIDGRRVITRFYEARKGTHSATVELTSADDAEVSYRANTAATMDRMGIFPPSPSGYNCSTCPVKSRCPIMASKS